MIKVISANVNGIRSAAKKGFFAWMERIQPDIVCIQETKAHLEHLTTSIFFPENYHHYFFDAHKKGYSGVAIYSRFKPELVHQGLGFPCADEEGRYIQLDFKSVNVASLYLPSGSSGEIRQAAKFDFLKCYKNHLQKQREDGRSYIICGDWNIVHQRIDIKNWSGNQKNSGCLPEERAWIEEILTEVGFVDAFRVQNQAADQYTWWSMRGQAYAKNVGWRIDYQMVTPDLAQKIHSVDIYKEERFSDHAPVVVEYNFDIRGDL